MTAMNPEQGRRGHGKLLRPRARIGNMNQKIEDDWLVMESGSVQTLTRIETMNH
jgi:hypothetical protein